MALQVSQNLKPEVDFELPNNWQVSFMVKQRKQEGGKTYHFKDFVDSFLPFGESSNSLKTILDNLALIPDFESRKRGIVTIMRDGILPAYEDVHNKGGQLLRMSFYQSQAASQKSVQDYKDALTSNDAKTADKYRKIAPFIENQNEFIHFFITLALTGGFNPTDAGSFNGLYIKTEFDLVCVDFWFNSKEGCQQVMLRLSEMLNAINLFVEIDVEDKEKQTRKIQDSLQTISMDPVDPTKRGMSQFKSQQKSQPSGDKSAYRKDSQSKDSRYKNDKPYERKDREPYQENSRKKPFMKDFTGKRDDKRDE